MTPDQPGVVAGDLYHRGMAEGLRIRRAVQAVVLDSADRVLLVRFEFPHVVLWAAPGGGLEPGEHPHDALRRELIEETGLVDPEIGPVIWTRTHVFPFLDGSYDGQTESFYLVRTEPLEPRPAMSWEDLGAEYVTDVRWWPQSELEESGAMFAPRRMPELIGRLVAEGPPPAPIDAGV